MFGRKFITWGAIILAVLFFASSAGFAGELVKIQSKIKGQKAGWIAGETSVSKLPFKDRQKRLGLFLPEKAPEDFIVADTSAYAKEQVAIPSSLDWRNNGGNFVTPVRNQGNCGSCWAFATAGALESATLLANNTPGVDINLAEQILVSCSGAGDCGGGYIDTASDFIRYTGLPAETCYPYTAQNGYCGNACANWQAASFKTSSWQWIATTYPTVETLKNALNAYGPLVTTMSVYYDFYYYKSGAYKYVSGSYQGGHGVLLVGYDDPGQYFVVKNSWGTGWGESGYFKVAYSELSSVVNFGRWTIAYSAVPNTTESSVKVTSPNGGETWNAGSAKTITWTYTGDPGYLKIELLKGSTVVNTISENAGKGSNGAGSFAWNIPASVAVASDYKIRITSTSNVSVSDTSDNSFAIAGQPAPAITVTSPNGGEILEAGSYRTISWQYTVNLGYIKIELLKGGSVANVITEYIYGGSGNSNSFSWKVPANIASGNDYRIKITSVANGSMTDTSDNFFTINGPSVTVTSPNGGETLNAGSSQTITWAYTGNPGSYVKVELLKGSSVVSTIASSVSKGSNGSGSVGWTVPASTVAGTDYKIKITSTSNTSITDASNNTFSIAANTPPSNSVTMTSPNGGETWNAGESRTITWTYTGDPGYLKVELLKGSSVVNTIATSVSKGSNGSGSLGWTVPAATVAGTDYKIKITSTSSASVTDMSNNNFTIAANTPPSNSVTMTSPNGGETWNAGESRTITWTYTGDPGYLKVELLKGSSVVNTIATSVSKGSNGSGSLGWTVPAATVAGTDYKIKITSASSTSVTDMSNSAFTIAGATPPPSSSITVTYPNGGETWDAGSSQTIAWKYSTSPGYIKIELLKGGSVAYILTDYFYGGSGNSGSFSWIVPSNIASGNDYRIRITSVANGSMTDASDNYFTINGPSVTVTSPNGGETWNSGSSKTISWNYTGNPGSYVKIELLKDSSVVNTISVKTGKGSNGSGSYTWTVPTSTVPGTDYRIKITSTTNGAITDTSDNNFTITN